MNTPGPEDSALVIPRGDLVYWNFNLAWSNGVPECWSNGKTLLFYFLQKQISDKLRKFKLLFFVFKINTPILHHSNTPIAFIQQSHSPLTPAKRDPPEADKSSKVPEDQVFRIRIKAII